MSQNHSPSKAVTFLTYFHQHFSTLTSSTLRKLKNKDYWKKHLLIYPKGAQVHWHPLFCLSAPFVFPLELVNETYLRGNSSHKQLERQDSRFPTGTQFTAVATITSGISKPFQCHQTLSLPLAPLLIALQSHSPEPHEADEDHMAAEPREQTPESSRGWWWAQDLLTSWLPGSGTSKQN